MRMKISGAAVGLSLLVLTTVPASAIESSIKGASAASADAVWTKIGDFCGIANWHPAIEKCVLSADGKTRTLSLKGGGTIVEKLEKRDDAAHSYSYSIVEGPLPVANYMSTISVAKEGAGSVITWSGKYDAKGASDADAKKTIDGVYQGGVDALVK
jgi:Polyketide cyclase / dehydrase and lipid transport